MQEQLAAEQWGNRVKEKIISNLLDRLQTERELRAEQAGHIALLLYIIAMPDKPRWHKYLAAFAAGLLTIPALLVLLRLLKI